ncbi:hypothetical protein ACVW1C_002300 [Bradyrhizobium sp. USDA 4011]
MPIRRLLEPGKYTPEEVEIRTKAFSLALGMMGLVDRNDPLCELVARKDPGSRRSRLGKSERDRGGGGSRIGLR